MAETTHAAVMADQPDVLADVREAFVQLWGSLGPFWGIAPTTARVHSWLLSRSGPA